MRLARKKRKALDATTSDGRDFKRMVEDVVAQLDAEKEAKAARKAMAAPQTQGKAKKAVVQEEEEEEEEEPEPQKLTKAHRKAKNLAQGGQGSGRGQTLQATALPPQESHGLAASAPYGPWPGYGPHSPWPGHCSYVPWPMSGPHGSCAGAPLSAASCGCPGPHTQQVSHPSPQPSQPQQPAPQGSQGNQGGGRRQNQGWGRGRGNGGRGNGRGNGGGNSSGRGNGGGNSGGGGNGDWNVSGNQSSQDGGRGFRRGRIDWRNAICWHCGQKGHTIKFCHVRRNDEDEGLISNNYDGDMYDKFGYYIDPEIPGGSRKEPLRRVEAGEPSAPPTMFRIWQEEDVCPDVRVEEIGENEEVEQERKADEQNIATETRVRGFLQFVRRPIRMFVKSIVERALHWGDCKRLLRSYYTPTCQAEERSMEKKRKELETERQDAKRTQRGGPSGGSDAPPQPAQDCPMADKGPELPQEPHGQKQSEEQAAREKEQDRKERATIEREIRVQIRLKNIAELHEKVEQGEQPVILEDRKGNDSPTQDDETPLFTEVLDNFDKFLEGAGRPREQHQEMGVKLVSTDLLSLKGLMKKGFAVAKTSDEKMKKRLTRVARASHEQRMDWQKEIGDLKKELERQDKEMEAMQIEVEKAWEGNEAIRQVNHTLNKVNDTLRTYLQVQQNIFQAKEAKWGKRIEDLEAKCAQQAPTAVVD
ncbi:hypothetical protein CBR_g27809 [Chara braunii]|uniref:CCHC-type domain-containing protein n=1 Tax=Chara braunii TaxID=69332 RepID=A0A388L8H7_CHABU|nr:hypothetical protein CBR_g27809 [Chara braunii]|eukprot:GBG78584.1 hypothetical protein CBR_g27809 [Chara braunii]